MPNYIKDKVPVIPAITAKFKDIIIIGTFEYKNSTVESNQPTVAITNVLPVNVAEDNFVCPVEICPIVAANTNLQTAPRESTDTGPLIRYLEIGGLPMNYVNPEVY